MTKRQNSELKSNFTFTIILIQSPFKTQFLFIILINSPFQPDPPTSIVTNFYTIPVKEPLPKKQDCFYLIAARRTIDILLRNTKQHTQTSKKHGKRNHLKKQHHRQLPHHQVWFWEKKKGLQLERQLITRSKKHDNCQT